MLANMKELIALHISCNYAYTGDITDTSEMDFNQLIMACLPTLNFLIIEYVNLSFNTTLSNVTSIKHLTLNHVGSSSALARIIESCFPNLVLLHLKDTLTSNITISLRDRHLKLLRVKLVHERNGGYSFLTETACVDGHQYHTITQNQTKVTHPIEINMFFCGKITFLF